jgi:RNA polymerase sigma-70 factor (ECF subfamily)
MATRELEFGESSDEDLLDRLRRGDRSSFGDLLRRYERELYGYLRRLVNDADLAEDVFQNTFLQLFLKREQYQTYRPARPWIYAIATNQAIDTLRRVGRTAAVSLDQTTDNEADGTLTSLLDALQARDETPLEQVGSEERRVLVRQTVDRLPETLRQTVLLAYYQGLKYREIAEALGIPVGTVKSRLHAALGRLHEQWLTVASAPEL